MALEQDTALDQASAPLPRSDPTTGQNVVAGLIGVGIAFGCFIPPGVHFVTGPLAPVIGGFFGGTRTGARGQDAMVIGATLGVGLAVLLGVAALVISAFVSGGTPSEGVALLVSGVALVYATLLGALGAYVGGRMERGKGG